MTKIQFYFDPGCPWCWNTSRWIKEVQKTQKVDVEWMSFSLSIKNGDSMNKDYLEKFKKSQEMLRIIEVAKEKYNGKLTDALYTEFGIKIHNDKDFSDAAISEVLKNVCSIDYDELLEAKNNDELDKRIRHSMSSAFDVVGKDVGIPIIVFENGNKKLGYFGPVLSQVPIGKDAINVWEGVSKLANYNHFFELKRTRDESATAPKNIKDKPRPNIC